MTDKAVFLDRDGVINYDFGYVYKPEDFIFLDGVFDFCRFTLALGYKVFIVTNQAGIGRGYYTEEDFLNLTEWMLGEFIKEDVTIEKVYHCPFHPEGKDAYGRDSFFRKPNPGMILAAAREFKLDLSRCYLVGDQESDITAAQRAGIGQTILISKDKVVSPCDADYVVENLKSIKLILSRSEKND